MRLELAAYPVRDVRFGAETRWRNEVLDIDRDEILDLVRRDPLVARAGLEVVRPGESARIVTIQDIIEPRVKAAGKGVAYPGLVGRAVETVGTGRTNRLAGFTLLRVLLGASGLGDPWASVTAAVVSSIGFAAAHLWAALS